LPIFQNLTFEVDFTLLISTILKLMYKVRSHPCFSLYVSTTILLFTFMIHCTDLYVLRLPEDCAVMRFV